MQNILYPPITVCKTEGVSVLGQFSGSGAGVFVSCSLCPHGSLQVEELLS